MGIYKVSTQELTDAITDTLDEVEGDFDRETLFEALEACKEYPHITK